MKVDASPVGLEVALAQRNSPNEPATVISYASELNKNIHKQNAIVWGLQTYSDLFLKSTL